jgi:sulfonate transport system permease protein
VTVSRQQHATAFTPEAPVTLHQFGSSYGYSAAGTGVGVRARPRGVRSRGRWWPLAGGLILPVAILVVWWIASSSGQIPSYRLPSPPAVVAAALDLAERGLFFQDVAISTQRVLLGFGAGSAIGLVLGALVGLSRTVSILLSPLIGALRAVPSLAWLPLLVLYLGIGEVPKVALITIGAAFPVFTTLAGALRHVDPHLVEVGRAYGLTRIGLLTTVQLPAVIPSVVSGLRLALAQSWLFLVAAELISSSMGLGFLLIDSGNNGRIDRLFLAIILLAILGTLTDGLIGVLERWLLRRWG